MSDWRSLLLSPKGGDNATRRFRVLEKPGHFFIYVPEPRQAAGRTLELYSAQRLRGRILRQVARFLLRCGFPFPGRKVDVPVSASTPFGQFMHRLVQGAENTLPIFGVMASYYRTDEHRYVLLLFDAIEHPRVVVKLGLSPLAREVIQRERSFFQPEPLKLPGLPHLIYSYSEPDGDAIAYVYEDGHTLGREDDTTQLSSVLTAWVWRDQSCFISELEKWKEVEALRDREPRLAPFLKTVAHTRVRPVVSHGDFVAWNIRVAADGEWRVIDWERGRRLDIPAWDWFHFVITYHLGVLYSNPEATATAIEQIWSDPQFLAYAELTGIREIIKEYTMVYLLHARHYFGMPDDVLTRVADEMLRRHFPNGQALAMVG